MTMRPILPAFLACALLACGTVSRAASLTVQLVDASGAPLQDAVAWAVPNAGTAVRQTRQAAVEQIDKAFVPLVTVIQAGTLVQFPNRDEIRHHVYSFSPAKVFELKLYAGTPVAPLLFDKAGEVVLGCNIHDSMIAYIYVVDSPYFGKAARDGRVRLENLPAGDYELRAWHYQQAGVPAPRAVSLKAEESAPLELAIALRPKVTRPGAR